MSMIRHSSSILKKLLFKNPSRIGASWAVLKKCGYGTIPPGYDYTHEDGENQVQLLDESQPLTPELRAKLAAKYNLRPEDYVPMAYGNSEITMGDYPLLPEESALERDPDYDWDDPFYRRNWGEPVPHNQEMYSPVFGPDTRPLPYDLQQMWKPFFFFVTGYLILFYIGGKLGFFFPAAPKQYPEVYAEDDRLTKGCYDYMENRGTDKATFKDRKFVVNYTFREKNDFSH